MQGCSLAQKLLSPFSKGRISKPNDPRCAFAAYLEVDNGPHKVGKKH